MAEEEKIYHNLRSRAVSLKGAVDLLQKCSPEKRDRVITLMREAARDIERLLTELEASARP
jgi:hypothetical protein